MDGKDVYKKKVFSEDVSVTLELMCVDREREFVSECCKNGSINHSKLEGLPHQPHQRWQTKERNIFYGYFVSFLCMQFIYSTYEKERNNLNEKRNAFVGN